jgi:DNA polymerase-3 subunit delta
VEVDDVIANARKGNLLPVYLVGGSERLLVQRCLDAIRLAAVGPGPRGLSEDLYDGKGLSAQVVVSAARTLPMMSKRRLVTVRGVDLMPSAEQDNLLAYFSKPEPSTVLVLVALQLDQRRRIAAEAKKHGFLVVAAPPKEDKLVPWVTREARSRGMQLDPGAVESMCLLVGPDLSLLSDALDRVQLFAMGRPVTAADVDQCITAVREVVAWDLADAIAERDLPSALSILGRLMAQRQPALPTLAVMGRPVYQIAAARRWLASKDPEKGSLGSVVKGPPQAVKRVENAARRWSGAHLARAVRILASADAALKGSKRDDARILEEAAIALCGGPGMGERPTR